MKKEKKTIEGTYRDPADDFVIHLRLLHQLEQLTVNEIKIHLFACTTRGTFAICDEKEILQNTKQKQSLLTKLFVPIFSKQTKIQF